MPRRLIDQHGRCARDRPSSRKRLYGVGLGAYERIGKTRSAHLDKGIGNLPVHAAALCLAGLDGHGRYGCGRLAPRHAIILFDLVTVEGPGNTRVEITGTDDRRRAGGRVWRGRRLQPPDQPRPAVRRDHGWR